MYAQESAIVQILLEIGHTHQAAGVGEQEEINAMICGFLHAQFIKHPVLVKLIHFQTYPTDLIPTLVDGVPSLHLCLEFAGELLNQGDMDRQFFAVRLATELVRRYPLNSR